MLTKFNSVRFKMSILYTLILGFILFSYSGLLFLGLQHTLYRELDSRLHTKAREIGAIINSYLDVLGKNHDAVLLAARRVIDLEGLHLKKIRDDDLESKLIEVVDQYDLRDEYVNLASPQSESVVRSKNFPHELLSKIAPYSKRCRRRKSAR